MKKTVGRWHALDALRFLAVLMMVQGHLFYALLHDASRAASWYDAHSYAHGFTAPLFLFVSGAAFGLTTFRRHSLHLSLSPAVKRRLERYVTLVGIGYFMHFELPSLSWLQSLSEERLAEALRVDALQHIGVTLLVLQALIAITTRARFFVLTTAGLSVVAVLAAPWLWRQDVTSLPVILAGYVNAYGGSYFPLAPWCAFIGLGVGAAYAVERGVSAGRLIVTGVAALVLGVIGTELDWGAAFGPHRYYKTNPWFFSLRAGVLVIGTGLASQILNRPLPRFVSRVSRETLAVYVAHLAVLYVPGVGLAHVYPRTLSLPQATVAAIGLIAAMIAFGLGWARFKDWAGDGFVSLRRALVVLAVLLFFGIRYG